MTLARNLPKPAKPPPPLTEQRCPICNHLLVRTELKPGSKVEAYCGHCHRHIVFTEPDRMG